MVPRCLHRSFQSVGRFCPARSQVPSGSCCRLPALLGTSVWLPERKHPKIEVRAQIILTGCHSPQTREELGRAREISVQNLIRDLPATWARREA
jgi:hypothetical protein